MSSNVVRPAAGGTSKEDLSFSTESTTRLSQNAASDNDNECKRPITSARSKDQDMVSFNRRCPLVQVHELRSRLLISRNPLTADRVGFCVTIDPSDATKDQAQRPNGEHRATH